MHRTACNVVNDFLENQFMSAKRTFPALAAGGSLVAVLALGVGGFLAFHNGGTPAHAANPTQAAPGTPVDVAAAIGKTVTDWQTYSGRLEAVDRVEIRPLVSGTIVAVHFKDGAMVKQGDPLFTIDPRPYAAAVDQASAALAAMQARSVFASSDLDRAKRLITDNAISRRDLDDKQHDALEATANLKAAQATLETARLNLGYTNIAAPVSGRVSRAEMTVGNVVTAGAASAPLTLLVSVSPIYAAFDVDEQTYLRYLSHDTRAGVVPVSLGLANESGYSRTGVVASVDNRLDTGSGTIRVRARFDNGDGVLLPGLYARIKVGGGAPHPAVLIDDRAIGTDQAKKFVMVVDAQNHAQYREIVPGDLQDGMRVVTSGLAAGEKIVVNGLQRVRPGDTLAPNSVPMGGSTVATGGTASVAAAEPRSQSHS
jgi:multidrug efflux system membrane fusion protein